MPVTFRASIVLLIFLAGSHSNRITIDDRATMKEVSTVLTAYYPDSEGEDGLMDSKGNRLHTLQDFLDGRAPYVTVSTDPKLNIPYGTPVLIPSLDDHFGTKERIKFEARDSAPNLEGAGFSRLDICVRSEQDSFDMAVNRATQTIFVLPMKKEKI